MGKSVIQICLIFLHRPSGTILTTSFRHRVVTSLYFRERYLYPALHRQRAGIGGDPWLVPFRQPGTLSMKKRSGV
jgi:hypothetical protein